MHIRTPPDIFNGDAPGFNPCLHAATGTRPVAGFVFNLAATNEILLCVCYLCLMTQPLQEPRVMPQAVTAVFHPIGSDRPIWAVRDTYGKQATTGPCQHQSTAMPMSDFMRFKGDPDNTCVNGTNCTEHGAILFGALLAVSFTSAFAPHVKKRFGLCKQYHPGMSEQLPLNHVTHPPS